MVFLNFQHIADTVFLKNKVKVDYNLNNQTNFNFDFFYGNTCNNFFKLL